jgi:hypothetical protein
MSRGPASAKTVNECLDRIGEPHRADARRLHKLIRATVPELKPFLSDGMIGYGPYHYRYPSGREGDTFIVGLAERKQGLALHVTLAVGGTYLTEAMADRFPRADVGKSCIRFRHLSDLDEKAIVALLRSAGKAAASQKATTQA